jgi:uncharacterized membrane protein YiaA
MYLLLSIQSLLSIPIHQLWAISNKKSSWIVFGSWWRFLPNPITANQSFCWVLFYFCIFAYWFCLLLCKFVVSLYGYWFDVLILGTVASCRTWHCHTHCLFCSYWNFSQITSVMSLLWSFWVESSCLNESLCVLLALNC